MKKIRITTILLGFMMVCIILAVISPFASESPDGLEKVAQDKGFETKQKEIKFIAITENIAQVIKNEHLTKILLSFMGFVLTFIITYGVARLLKKK
jgi:cobalt/nickel transport protein